MSAKPSPVCPDASELRAFAIGDLVASDTERLAGHLAACARCAEAMTALDDATDPLVLALRGVPAQATGRPAGEVVVVDLGRRIACELRQGPRRLGRFELEQEVGVGSFGHVFRARDLQLDRTVALKIPRSGQLDDAADKERFLREARNAAQLVHPGIVSLYETGETEDGISYLVSEYVEGRTLEAFLRDGSRDFPAMARLVAEVAMALAYAHAHGVIHRDVKPSNIILDREGRPHVTDFGLAKRVGGEATVTPAGEVLGTPAYMSPEVAAGEAHDADGRSDVFSLGVILYELLTGQRPFQGNRRALLQQVLEEEPRPPHRVDDRVPLDLATICLKAMAKSPARRYARAQELAEDLLRFVRGEPVRARPVGVAERLWRWGRRNPLAVTLFLLVILGSACGFLYLSWLSGELVRRSALASAEQYAELLELVNDLYTTEVVDRVGHHGVEATADYAATAAATIPLPATLMTMLLERISRTDSGMRGRRYSEFPFRTRQNGPRDAFEHDALAFLKAQPSQAFFRYTELEGGEVLRYAKARVLVESCVACHNKHPDSPEHDWRVGDVGVLSIVRPLESDALRAQTQLRGAFVGIAIAAALALLALGAFLALFARR